MTNTTTTNGKFLVNSVVSSRSFDGLAMVERKKKTVNGTIFSDGFAESLGKYCKQERACTQHSKKRQTYAAGTSAALG